MITPRHGFCTRVSYTPTDYSPVPGCAQAKLIASSFAARAAVIPWPGSPRSRLFLFVRWVWTHVPSFLSSDFFTQQSPCRRLYFWGSAF